MSNLARIEALTTRIKNMKAQSAKAAKVGTQSILTSGGGLLGGVIDAKLPKIPNTNLDTVGVAGAIGVLAAMTGFFDEHSDSVGSVGSGMLAYCLGKEAREYFS
jgi:hypothetical protein